jgi:hypothetical protein
MVVRKTGYLKQISALNQELIKLTQMQVLNKEETTYLSD